MSVWESVETVHQDVLSAPASHKMDKHQCEVNGYNKGLRKICAHVVVKCANCGGNHPANFNRCTSSQKAKIDARKQKSLRKTSKNENAGTKPISKGETENKQQAQRTGTRIVEAT